MLIANAMRYVGAVLGLSLTGSGALIAGFEVGGLVVAASPLAAAIIVRAIGGDGLRGVGLGLTGTRGWYWLGFVLFPVAMSTAVGLGFLAGAVEFRPDVSTASLAASALAGLLPGVSLALGEEFGWRGYFTPLLEANRVRPLVNHAIVGATTVLWHVPFIAATPTYTDQPVWLFAPLFALGVMATSVTLGETRLRTKSVWPAVFASSINNAFGSALLSDGVFARMDTLWFAPRPEAIVTVAVFGAIAIGVCLVPRPPKPPPTPDALPPFLFMP